MSPLQEVLTLVEQQNSSDNNIRKLSEIQFNQFVANNPTDACFALMQLTLDQDSIPIDLRQSCLLHLRRCVPKYWSGGFESFVGPPVNQDLKLAIRTNLLELATRSTHSKIRKGAAYVIVQIAAADYPDEWPDLLTSLFSATLLDNDTAVVGGLTVLNDLFDDLITDDQFWDQDVGSQLINHIFQLLSKPSLSSEAKTAAVVLLNSIINTLNGSEAYTSEQRKDTVKHYVNASTDVLLLLLANHAPRKSPFYLQDICLQSNIHKALDSLLTNFSKKIDLTHKKQLLKLILQDINFAAKVYHSLAIDPENATAAINANADANADATASATTTGRFEFVTSSDLQEPIITFSHFLQDLFQSLTFVQNSLPISTNEPGFFNQFLEDLMIVSQLPKDLLEDYQIDFNVFVTETAGLSSSTSVRDSIGDFLLELNDLDSVAVSNNVLQLMGMGSWLQQEGFLYILESIFINTDVKGMFQNLQLEELLHGFGNFISSSVNPILVSRCFLMLPKFFEHFQSRINVQQLAGEWFVKMIQFVINNSSGTFDEDLIKILSSSVLLSCTFYLSLMDLSKAVGEENQAQVQTALLTIVNSLLEDAEEDTLPALLEAVDAAVEISPKDAVRAKIDQSTDIVELIFNVAYKDPSDVQVILGATSSLSLFLEHVPSEEYNTVVNRSMPVLFNVIQSESTKEKIEFTPKLNLSLELLNHLIDCGPSGGLSTEVFNYCFPIVKNIILRTSDDQILQTGGQVFNSLIGKDDQTLLKYVDPDTNHQSGLDIVLQIASKFLSPELSDSAALNSGTIIFTVIEKFLNVLGSEFSTSILEATVRRLLLLKAVVTTENLVMVFCKLVLNSPEEMINFLSQTKFPNPKTGVEESGLGLVLPIWFQSFEIIRGYDQIKQNVLAIAKLFSLGDSRLDSLLVDGDIIPYEGDKIITRSMKRDLPERYNQISASLKILKLLVGELGFQFQQPDAKDYLPEEVLDQQDGGDGDGDGDGDDDGWEDMDDIGVPNYEKLKSYIDSDDEDNYQSHGADDDLKQLLVQFFKECTAKNLGNFQQYYEQLSEDEKKEITQNVVFT